MEEVSFWQVITPMILILAMPLPAVLLNQNKPGIGRGLYAGLLVGLFILAGGLHFAVGGNEGIDLSKLTVLLVTIFLICTLFTRRLSDAGWSVWLSYIILLPVVNLLFALGLMFIPSREQESDPM
ncbi:DUF805 domain-containing protein [Magnetovibrio sp. PR-2]|uniref:DUF805 domain-containing protein n=1 Tax=Magnetovibrio sp. PR-2 TaxID=3120356 RepID=UPI002FCE2DE7